MKTDESRNYQISNLIIEQIVDEHGQIKTELIKSLEILLNGNYKKYEFDTVIKKTHKGKVQTDFNLSKFNELTSLRKLNGAYYTPQDLTNYITLNTILMATKENNTSTFKDYKALESILAMEEQAILAIITEKTIFDPTCGSGEFLINAAEIKLNLLESKFNTSDEFVLSIAKTIFGNDINEEAVDIAMFRLFNTLRKKITNEKNYSRLAQQIKKNFTTYDFVNYQNEMNTKFDIILGNPPYIEYSKYTGKINIELYYGNVYADVVHNTISLIKNNGAFGYVLPLSYVATNRMTKLRELIIENFSTQFVLSFADRPDCLFTRVHQKLNIVIAKKGKSEHKLFTSKYNIWRKEERSELLNGCEIIRVFNGATSYIPKIGNAIEESIFRKVRTVTNRNLFDIQTAGGDKIYLNMRAAFWIKAFTHNPGSKEYKIFSYEKEKRSFVLAILNSSLYWMFWTILSDGWHITSKELKEFLVPNKEIDYEKFDSLVKKLENKLEKTKKYIGSKQTEYEYKHKECKNVIDKIDDALAEIYELTDEELNYIKNFHITYRTGDKND